MEGGIDRIMYNDMKNGMTKGFVFVQRESKRKNRGKRKYIYIQTAAVE